MTAFERRTRRLQSELSPGQAVVLCPSPNLYYLTGVWETPSERAFFAIIGAEGDPAMVVPELAAAQVRAETWVEDVRAWGDADEPMAVVDAAVDDQASPVETYLLDPTMWARFSEGFRHRFPAASYDLAESVMSALRVRKDEAELAALRDAATIADAVSIAVRGMGEDAIGRTETELARTIEDRLSDRGGTGVSFETIVGSAAHGAHPHHTHGDREIEPGDPVVLDFGTRVDHYPSDQTRTVVFGGEPPDGFVDAHTAVLDAQAAAVDAIEPGVTAETVDAAARDLLEARGYGDAFIHRTGHGVGLDVHEPPYIVAGSDRRLEPGMVFSVEPGVYIEDRFGVRIEDLVVVTEDGCERLNDSPRGWRPPDRA